MSSSPARRLRTLCSRLWQPRSVSTAGSIVGTFVAAFWLVPELGPDQVLAVAAVTLLVAAAGDALAERLLPVALPLEREVSKSRESRKGGWARGEAARLHVEARFDYARAVPRDTATGRL
jgi:uncharacterized membrane protein